MMKPGRWAAASYVLGREVLVREPYPHICGNTVQGRMSPHVTVRLWRKECAACIQEEHDARGSPPVGLPPLTEEQRALEARRMGERED
jgi:hypothetical protein